METTAPEPWTHQRVSASGITFHYVEAGAGPLVLLLHGFPEFWYSWRDQIPALATRFRVVAVDMRGYNETDKPASGYDMATLVEDAAALVAALGETTAALVGHDWGGAIAWEAASRRPDVFTRLAVLNGPHPTAMALELRSNPAQLARSWYIFFFQVPRIPEWWLGRNGFDPFIRGAIPARLAHPERFGEDDVARYREAISKPGAIEAALAYYRQAFRGALRAGRPPEVRVDVPTLVIWGDPDFALGRELDEGLDRWVRDVRVEIVENSSHWVQQDAPETVNRLLLDFLTSAPT